MPLPDIILSANHYDAQSTALNNLHETRDDRSAQLRYSFAPTAKLNVSFSQEEFKDLTNRSEYDTTTSRLETYRTGNGNYDWRITGQTVQRDFRNYPGKADSTEESTELNAGMNIRQNNRLTHSYSYYFRELQSNTADYADQGARGNVQYQFLPELSFSGGLQYAETEFRSNIPEFYKTTSTTADGGTHYNRLFAPVFLEPFTFQVQYGLSGGVKTVQNDVTGKEDSGRYYANNLALGLNSAGWKQENLYLNYTYVSKRDHSSLGENSWIETTSAGFSSRRIPRTTVKATGLYIVQNRSASPDPAVFMNTSPGTVQDGRTFRYEATVDHALADFLSLQAGLSRGTTQTNIVYSLATVQPAAVTTTESLRFVGALFNHQFTRYLGISGNVREEWRENNQSNVDSTALIANAMLTYRIRMIFVNAEYRWREDDNSLTNAKTQQQYVYLKVSRPF